LYINDNQTQPNSTYHKYKDVGWPGNTWTMETSNQDFKYGRWTFAVYGREDSEFLIRNSIMPHQGNLYRVVFIFHIGALRQGVPQIAHLTPKPVKYITFGWWMTKDEDYLLTVKDLSPETTSYLTAFVSQEHEYPNATHHTWKFENVKHHYTLVLDKAKIKSNSFLSIMLSADAPTNALVTLGAQSCKFCKKTHLFQYLNISHKSKHMRSFCYQELNMRIVYSALENLKELRLL